MVDLDLENDEDQESEEEGTAGDLINLTLSPSPNPELSSPKQEHKLSQDIPCPVCQQDAIVDMSCSSCDVILGICPKCSAVGPMGVLCRWCPDTDCTYKQVEKFTKVADPAATKEMKRIVPRSVSTLEEVTDTDMDVTQCIICNRYHIVGLPCLQCTSQPSQFPSAKKPPPCAKKPSPCQEDLASESDHDDKEKLDIGGDKDRKMPAKPSSKVRKAYAAVTIQEVSRTTMSQENGPSQLPVVTPLEDVTPHPANKPQHPADTATLLNSTAGLDQLQQSLQEADIAHADSTLNIHGTDKHLSHSAG